MSDLSITEVFYSVQGEGARAGSPSVFIRLQGCSASQACRLRGVACDTDYRRGTRRSIESLLAEVLGTPCRWVVWTGGEPLDQLTPSVTDAFHRAGIKQALETSGYRRPWPGMSLDWVSVSPKVTEDALADQWRGARVDELRYVLRSGDPLPMPSLEASHYYLSPHNDGEQINWENVSHCLALCQAHPEWRLSMQLHKWLGVR